VADHHAAGDERRDLGSISLTVSMGSIPKREKSFSISSVCWEDQGFIGVSILFLP